MHGRLAIISLRPDISRVGRPVLHARTTNDAIFSMIAGGDAGGAGSWWRPCVYSQMYASAHAHSIVCAAPFHSLVGRGL